MAESAFQHPYTNTPGFPVNFTGVVKDLILRETSGLPPKEIIKSGDAFDIEVHWEVAGTACGPGMLSNSNRWSVNVFYESIGPGDEDQLGTTQVVNFGPMGPTTYTPGDPLLGPNSRHYKATIAGLTINLGPGDTTRAFKLITVITVDDGGSPPTPMEIAGFLEGPIIQVYRT